MNVNQILKLGLILLVIDNSYTVKMLRFCSVLHLTLRLAICFLFQSHSLSLSLKNSAEHPVIFLSSLPNPVAHFQTLLSPSCPSPFIEHGNQRTYLTGR